MAERMVMIKSMANSTVAIYEPAYNVRKIFPKRGSKQVIPFDVVEQLLWTNGFRNMLDAGVLYIENMQDKIDLGLEEPDTKEPTRYKVLNDAQMLTLMKIKSVEDFKKDLADLPKEQINNLVSFAVKNEYLDSEKASILKALTGKDIIKMVSRKHENEELDRLAAEKEQARREEGRRV